MIGRGLREVIRPLDREQLRQYLRAELPERAGHRPARADKIPVVYAPFYAYIVPFLISTAVGSIIAGVLVYSLQRSGALRSMQNSLS